MNVRTENGTNSIKVYQGLVPAAYATGFLMI